MTRTLSLVVLATVVAAGCGRTETPKSPDGNTNGSAKPDPARKAVSLPADLPDDIPVYPGAEPVFVGQSEGGIRQSSSTSLQLETTDSVEAVRTFYEKQMQDQSWAIGHTTPAMLNAKKGERNLNVTIVENPRSPGTVVITIVYN